MLRSALHALRSRAVAAPPPRRMCTVAAAAVDAAAAAAQPLSRDLMRCRTTSDFISYALRRGANIKRQRGTHATLEANGVCCTLVNSSKKDLQESARKMTFAVFERMGIARDARARRGGEQGALWGAHAAQRPAPEA